MRIVVLALLAACSAPQRLDVATTTSIEASGLLARLQPEYERQAGVRLRFAVAGTGQALKLLERGDVEAALTHDPEGERALVRRGLAERVEVMRNDFVLVGPAADPAGARGRSIEQAMGAIRAGGHPFVSRGDDSGTHRAELRLWRAAGVGPGPGYRESGQGMGETLVMASELGAYTLVDAATLRTFHGRIEGVGLVSPALDNLYSALWRTERGGRFARWLRSPGARAIIGEYFEPVPDS